MDQGGVCGTLMRSNNILSLKTQTYFLILLQLQLFEFFFAEEQTICSVVHVTRQWPGDRISFVNYTGACNEQVNPCERISNSEWTDSAGACICHCHELTSTYYGKDNESCVENRVNREGCNLRFKGELVSSPLKVFKSSINTSVQLATLPRESCKAMKTYYIVTDETSRGWVEFVRKTPAFSIYHENRKRRRHDHFLEWYNRTPVAALSGKIVKVNIQCKRTRQGEKEPRNLCIVFKVEGSVYSLPCLAGLPSSDPRVTVSSTVETMIVSSKTRTSNETTRRSSANVVTRATEPVMTKSKTPLNKGHKSNINTKVALPIWLIAVIAVGAVIATLTITVIIWICCKMKRRSRRRRKKRSKMENPLYNNDDDTVITFATSGVASGVDEAGYARVGSPCRKGYAVLKPGAARCNSDYQRLLKPGEDVTGYLVPMEERTSVVPTTPAETESPFTDDGTIIYSEADSPLAQDQPNNKEYDYAKPDDVVCMTSSRSSLDKLDENATNEVEPGYAQSREHSDSNETAASPPFYEVVEQSNPGELTDEGPTLSENDILNADSKPEYIELLPVVGAESGKPVLKEDSVA